MNNLPGKPGSTYQTIHPQETFSGHVWVETDVNHCLALCETGVVGGRDVDGSQIYLGRAIHNGDILPAKVIPGRRSAYVSYCGKEIRVHQFQMLVRPQYKWVTCQNGYVPPNAFPAGETLYGETLYAGRVTARGATTIGKVHPSHKCCYIPFCGKEEKYDVYEVLVMTQPPKTPPPYSYY
ncbi:uncharacterized protein LOC113380251 [Ctenocephalides felis]|uniref:uncharacterized protein LOC113380251 n=1 Tax=Ctenocephalides felis TaxID=7515 RepID=UPI000E6E2A26|nr:uncharacterized protein LOC113380251 [Ctenocephalides felis]